MKGSQVRLGKAHRRRRDWVLSPPVGLAEEKLRSLRSFMLPHYGATSIRSHL